jgi:thioredoxin-related protein
MFNKKIFAPLFVLILSFALLSMMIPKSDQIELGDKLPNENLKMENIDNTSYSLDELAGQKGTLVIFSCNTCPFVIGNGEKSEGWQNRYPGIGELCSQLGVEMVLINSNVAKREKGDSMEDMKLQYNDEHYSGYYLLDKNAVMADSFGAQTTPHVFLFNSSSKLVYKGAIDDNVNRKDAVERDYLIDALNNMVNGNRIEPSTTKNIGCSIKRV